ncbi:response regulator [Spirochaetia bacterium 38H-sp]|uniref:Response regulator n=1 Tax=Rarispira pelagica TaxID=3141764 RepID=A0ABU9UCE5_9SPIR
MTVVIVDDSRIMRNIVKSTLDSYPEFAGSEYLEASNGADAFEIINSKKVDLLLLDWNMPQLNGLELTKKLRADKRFSSLPIIMVTSEAAKYNVIEAVKEGVDDYIVKPVKEDELLKKVKRVLEAK